MSQIWGLVESVQVVAYLQLFAAKIPGNVQTFLSFFMEITEFEVLPAEKWTEQMMYDPESVAPSINFQQAGHDSALLVPNLGSLFYIMLGYVGLYVFYFFVVWPLTKLCPKVKKVTDKLKNFLLWNGSIRFFIESYIQITLFTVLNLKAFEWDADWTLISLSHVLAIVSMAVVTLLPIALIIYYACNINKWWDEKFCESKGAFLEGTDLDRMFDQWIVLLVPLSYFLRRLFMSFTLVFWIDFLWGQLFI